MADLGAGAPLTAFVYQPALDGLRAIAVLLVLVYHNSLVPPTPGGLHGGFLGVDVFFVLSGYLITSLLLVEHGSSGRIAVRAFWGRRVRRLLPALLLLLVMAAAYAAFTAAAGDLARIRGDALATVLYVQNWHLVAVNLRDGSVLNHAWSLSVEEQWYLIWPGLLALILVWQRSNRARVAVTVLALAAVSAGWTYALHERGSSMQRIYYGTDTSAQELLAGALLGVLLYRRSLREGARETLEILGLLAAFVVGYMVLTSRPNSPFLAAGGYAVFAVAVAAVIAAAVQPGDGIIRAVLSFRPLRAIGLISYGVYLYHWPLYFWLTPARTHTSGIGLLLVRIAVSLVVATISFVLIERPIRTSARVRAKSLLLAPIAVLVVVGVVLVATREPAAPPLISNATMAVYSRIPSAAGARRVLVVGETRAFQLEYEGGTYQQQNITGLSVGLLGCGLVRGDFALANGRIPQPRQCAQRVEALHAAAASFRPDVVVLMPGDFDLFNLSADGHTYRLGTPSWAKYVSAQLDSLRTALVGATNAPTMLVTVPCEFSPTHQADLDAAIGNTARRRTLNQLLESYATARRGTTVITDPSAAPCPEASASSPAAPEPEAKPLDAASARQVWSWLAAEVAALPATKP